MSFDMENNFDEPHHVALARDQAIHDVAMRLRLIGDDMDKKYSKTIVKDLNELFHINVFRDVLLELKQHFVQLTGYLHPK